MRRGRRSTLAQRVVGILIALSSPWLAGCAVLTANSGSERQGTVVSATPPYPTSIEELRQRPLRPPTAAIITTCPWMPAHQDLQVVLATGLIPGKPPPNGPFDGYGVGPVYLTGQTTFYPGASDLALWFVKPPYAGPLVIRGREVNGTARATFSQQLDGRARPTGPTPGAPVSMVSGAPFYSELDFPAVGNAPYRRAYFAETHYDVGGCYLIQVDGSTFTETILLEVSDAAQPLG